LTSTIVRAVSTGDAEASEAGDLLVKQVDRGGINILIRFQPLASDFRAVLATIKY